MDGLKNKQDTYVIKEIRISKDRITVVLEDEKIDISEEAYLEYRLKDLKLIDAELYEKLLTDQKNLKAYRSCLRKLAARDRSCFQIREHLKRLELADEDCEKIVSRLKDYGLLDDRQYAENRIAQMDRQLYSFRQMRQKLSKEGIDEQLISGYLEKDTDRQQEKADQLAERFIRNSRNRPAAASRKTALQKLVNSGFSYEEARHAVAKQEMSYDNDMPLLEKEYAKAYRRLSRKYEGRTLKEKLTAQLMSRGFRYEDIKKMMEAEDEQTS